MSLQTDRIFLEALNASSRITALVGDRIYPIAVPGLDEDVLNTPLPYLVVTFEPLTNLSETKDNPYQGDEDRVTIGIEVAAESPDDLTDLAELVRSEVDTFMQTYTPAAGDEDLTSLIPLGYDFSTTEKTYDWLKPCYFMTLRYQCDTNV